MEKLYEILGKFVKMPLVQRVGILGGVLVLIFILYVYLLYIPIKQDVSDLEETYEASKKNYIREKSKADDLPRYEEELKKLHEKLNEALAKLPNKSDISQLLMDIPNLSRELNLDVVKFEPRPEIKQDFVAEVPLAIEVRGPFKTTIKFFERLGKLPRIINVKDIYFNVISPKKGEQKVQISGKFIAVTYRFMPEEERERNKKENEKKGKKK